MHTVVIIDTGCSNFASLKWAIEKLEFNTLITRNKRIIKNAEKIILPGIGTADNVMSILEQHDLIEIIKDFKNPMLGICLGMQLFCSFSKEFGCIKTLGIFHLPVLKMKQNNLSFPHTGWNKVIFKKDNLLFKDINIGSRFYFVHSYAVPISTYTTAFSFYGQLFSSSIQKKNFFGVQFHPEKSGIIGSQLLKNFLEI